MQTQNILLTLLLGGGILLNSCVKEDQGLVPFDPAKDIVLNSYTPHEGNVGSQMIIRGENFGNDPSKIKVWIDNDEDRQARVISTTGDRIYAIVPARAGSGIVSIAITDNDGVEHIKQFDAEGDDFKYEFKRNLGTLVGGGQTADIDGDFKEAKFVRPLRLCLDEENQRLFVLQTGDAKALRMVDLVNETVSTPWRAPNIQNLRTICFGSTTDTLFVGVEGGAADVSTVYLLAADGFVRNKTYAPRAGSNASTFNPVDSELFINDYWEGSVYRWDRDKQEMVKAAQFFNPNTDFTFCWSRDGKYLYGIAMEPGTTSLIVRAEYDFATKSLGEVQNWVGVNHGDGFEDGIGTEARINRPYQMCSGGDNEYFLADTWNHCVRRIVDRNGEAHVELYAGVPGAPGMGEGDPLEAKLMYLTGIAATSDGSTVYVADKENDRIVKITIE